MFRLALPVIFFVACALAVELPSNFKTCHRDDSNLNGCLKSAVQSAFKDLIAGSKQLKVATIEPLHLKKLDIDQGSDRPVAIKLNFKDVDIHGIGSIIVDSVDAKLNGTEKTLILNLVAAKPLIIKGQYVVDGNVLILAIKGSGNAELNLLRVKATIKLVGSLVKRLGEEYLIFKQAELDLVPTEVTLKFENLFNGDKALGDNMNKFLNENWEEVYGDLKAAIEKAFAHTIADISHAFFAKVPYNSIFPSSS